jgi:hypothetical protein
LFFPWEKFPEEFARDPPLFEKHARYPLCSSGGVASLASTYDEPTVMWRMRRGSHLRSHAVLGVRGRAAWVMWFLNDHAMSIRDFDDWESAVRWSDRLRDQNWAAGWRLLPEDDDVSPAAQI